MHPNFLLPYFDNNSLRFGSSSKYIIVGIPDIDLVSSYFLSIRCYFFLFSNVRVSDSLKFPILGQWFFIYRIPFLYTVF